MTYGSRPLLAKTTGSSARRKTTTCDSSRWHTRLTDLAEYSTGPNSDEVKYEAALAELDAATARSINSELDLAPILGGGGFWAYATWPSFEMVGTLTVGNPLPGGTECSFDLASLLKIAPGGMQREGSGDYFDMCWLDVGKGGYDGCYKFNDLPTYDTLSRSDDDARHPDVGTAYFVRTSFGVDFKVDGGGDGGDHSSFEIK